MIQIKTQSPVEDEFCTCETVVQTSQLPNYNGEELAARALPAPVVGSLLSHRRAVGATMNKPLKSPFITAVCTTDVLSGLRGRLWPKPERAPLRGILSGSASGRNQTSGNTTRAVSSLASGRWSGPALCLSMGHREQGSWKGAYRAAGETGIHEHMKAQENSPSGTGCSCCCLVTKLSCPTLCNPVGSSPPGSSVQGISQARILELVTISFSEDLPHPGIEPVSPALAGGVFTTEPPGKPSDMGSRFQIQGQAVMQGSPYAGMARAAWIYCPESISEGESWVTLGTGWWDSLSWDKGMSREQRRVLGKIYKGI